MKTRRVEGTEARVTFHGRSYWDVEVPVPFESLAATKSKVDAPVTAAFGGFACNAARAIAGRFAPGSVRVVTAIAWLDWPRLRRSLPEAVALDAILTGVGDDAMPPMSVILDPASACRILRDRREEDSVEWRIDRVSSGALDARLHVLGRVPSVYALAVLARARTSGARFAWCGGDAVPLALERECDLLSVNTAEGNRLLGSTGKLPRELAEALARRASTTGMVRVVTGGGGAATVAAIRGARGVTFVESAPAPIPRARIRRLLGVGDVFAAHFTAGACFDEKGSPRRTLDVVGALAVAQREAERALTSKR